MEGFDLPVAPEEVPKVTQKSMLAPFSASMDHRMSSKLKSIQYLKKY